MLSIKYIRENPEEVKKKLAKKLVKPVLVDDVLSLDKKHRELQQMLDGYRMEQNKISEEIAAEKDNEAKNRKINQMQLLKAEIKKLGSELENSEKALAEAAALLPNLPHDFVPEGKDATGNAVVREVGAKPIFSFPPKDYLEIAETLDIIDTKRAAKVSGSRFGYLKRGAALLEFALIQLAVETLTKEGFIPIVPPVLVRPEMLEAMGIYGAEKNEVFTIEKDGLCLIGTSEQSIGPMHKDEIFTEAELPKRYLGFSSCFRREAGSYGKDTKGILRVHQFDKLEMFSVTTPEDSQNEHKYLLSLEEKLMQELKLHYRVVLICGGDMNRQSAATYDIETWLPGQNQYRETHSVSDTTSFQSLDLNIRYRPKSETDGMKPRFAHMLNATAFAIGRMIIAIIENYQKEDGSIEIPEALRKYMSGTTEIRSTKSEILNKSQ